MQIDFVANCSVYRGGYEWYDSQNYAKYLMGSGFRKKSRAAQLRFRAAGPTEDIEKRGFRHYDPFLTAPALFLELSELSDSEQAILDFVNRYGNLWNDFVGPCLIDYLETIADLRLAVDLWQAVQQENEEALRRHVSWDRAGRLRWKSELSHPTESLGETIHVIDVINRQKKYKVGDLLTPATDLLDFVVSRRPTWSMQLVPIRKQGVVSMQIDVRDLFYIIWVQFALAVAENKTFAHCQFCNRPYELRPQVNRADKMFCTDNCRVKAYQRRKRQAIELHAQGKAIREIAKATNSDVDTVKKWTHDLPKGDLDGKTKAR